MVAGGGEVRSSHNLLNAVGLRAVGWQEVQRETPCQLSEGILHLLALVDGDAIQG